MADLRIVDAPEIPTNNITGREKIPTGGSGNYSITLDSLADYTKTKKDLADNTSVDGKVNGVRQELDAHVEDLTNPHQVTKDQIGLGNVDNTADLDKPVSDPTQAAIISAVMPKADKSYVDAKDGDLGQLNTTDKTNLVEAINEVQGNTNGVVALYNNNVELVDGANGWSDLLITTQNNRTQRDINRTALTIRDFGGVADGVTDDTIAMQAYHDYCVENKLQVDLKQWTVKIKRLDIDSGTYIKNGTLDVTSYDFGDGGFGSNNWRRTPIMSKKTNRNHNVDFEYDTMYENIDITENVTFENVTIISDKGAMVLYKVRNFDFINCTFLINTGALVQFIGGYHGTTIPNDDGDGDFNLLTNLKNGRNENIRFIHCKADTTNTTDFSYCSPVRFVGCKNALVESCLFKNMKIFVHADTFNENVRILNNQFLVDNPLYINADATTDFTNEDVLGIYMGQNSYDYTIIANKMSNVFKPIYIEGASIARIKNNTFEKNTQSLADTYAAIIQANIRDAERTKLAGCCDIDIIGNTVVGYKYGFAVQTALVGDYWYKDINISNNNITTNHNITSIFVHKASNITIASNSLIGNVQLGGVKNTKIIANKIFNKNNYALYVTSLNDDILLSGNILEVEQGNLIYTNNTNGFKLKIEGGKLLSKGSITAPGVTAIDFCTDMVNTKTENITVDLAPNGIKISEISWTGMKPGYIVSITQQSLAYYAELSPPILLEFKADPSDDKVYLVIRNIGSQAVSFPAVFFLSAKPVI